MIESLSSAAGITALATVILVLATIWYVREARLSRKAADLQASTSQKAFQEELHTRLRDERAIFVWRDGGQSDGNFYKRFENRGGPISDCFLHCPSARAVSVVSGEFIGTDQLGAAKFEFDHLPESFDFEFGYRTKSGKITSHKFIVVEVRDGGRIKETRLPERIG